MEIVETFHCICEAFDGEAYHLNVTTSQGERATAWLSKYNIPSVDPKCLGIGATFDIQIISVNGYTYSKFVFPHSDT